MSLPASGRVLAIADFLNAHHIRMFDQAVRNGMSKRLAILKKVSQ
jgi:hypothetical protein